MDLKRRILALDVKNMVQIDKNLFIQGTPSIIISVLGMIFTGHLFKLALENPKISSLPFVFESNSIISLKTTWNYHLLYI